MCQDESCPKSFGHTAPHHLDHYTDIGVSLLGADCRSVYALNPFGDWSNQDSPWKIPGTIISETFHSWRMHRRNLAMSKRVLQRQRDKPLNALRQPPISIQVSLSFSKTWRSCGLLQFVNSISGASRTGRT